MKVLFKRSVSLVGFILFMFGSAETSSFASNCVDLSHVSSEAGIVIRKKQIGCDQWTTVQVVDGEPVFDPEVQKISPEWSTMTVDDEYEKTNNRWLLTWNRTRTRLIHEYTVYSIDKKTTEIQFTTVSENYSLLENGLIRVEGQKLVRIEKVDGSIQVSSQPVLKTWPKP